MNKQAKQSIHKEGNRKIHTQTHTRIKQRKKQNIHKQTKVKRKKNET